ncbi:hypothetical protein [Novipirellula sp.]|uniref:hypothetical protein n=1 Tax=Novipirellula sp. TaxID=2795430 RepID=UPI0035624E69
MRKTPLSSANQLVRPCVFVANSTPASRLLRINPPLQRKAVVCPFRHTAYDNGKHLGGSRHNIFSLKKLTGKHKTPNPIAPFDRHLHAILLSSAKTTLQMDSATAGISQPETPHCGGSSSNRLRRIRLHAEARIAIAIVITNID